MVCVQCFFALHTLQCGHVFKIGHVSKSYCAQCKKTLDTSFSQVKKSQIILGSLILHNYSMWLTVIDYMSVSHEFITFSLSFIDSHIRIVTKCGTKRCDTRFFQKSHIVVPIIREFEIGGKEKYRFVS